MKTFLKLCVLLAIAGCSTYETAKTWADTTCDVIHALPAASLSALPSNSAVVVEATSASVTATETNTEQPTEHAHKYVFPMKQ